MEQSVDRVSMVATRRAPLLSKPLLTFMVTMVLANTAWHMIWPLLPLYLKSLNASVVQVGLFFTLSQIVPLALQILGGWLSDSLGRLRSIAMGSVAGLVSYVGLILAPTWQWVLLGEGIGSIAGALVAPSFGAFIAENSTQERRARVFGISESIFMLVAVIGPPLGGWLADTYGFKMMIMVATVLYSLATILRIAMARSAARTVEANPQHLSLASLRLNLGTMTGLMLAGGLVTWLLLTDGVRDIAFTMAFNLLPVYLKDVGGMSIQQVGWQMSFFGIAVMAVTLPAGWLADKKGERLAIALGFVLQYMGLMVFTRATTFVTFTCAWVLMGFGVGCMSPALSSLMSKSVPEKLRGTAFGFFSTSIGLISLPAPALGAQLWQRVNPRFPFIITAWLALLAIIPVWVKLRPKGEKDG